MILAGDIGGTKTMLAVFSASPAAGRGADRRAPGFERDSGVVETYDSRDFAHFDEILRDFCARHRPQLRAACIGVAGPVRKNRCSATHLPWTIDGAELARSLGLGGCALLNDLAAVGYGIDVLREDEIEELQAGAPGASGNRAVIAAGTGLGEAGLFWDGAAHRPFATEGGHADFAPQDELEIGLLRFLQQEREPVSWERVVSGPGLVSIFRFLLDLQPAGARAEGAPGLAGMAEAMTSAEPEAGAPSVAPRLSTMLRGGGRQSCPQDDGHGRRLYRRRNRGEEPPLDEERFLCRSFLFEGPHAPAARGDAGAPHPQRPGRPPRRRAARGHAPGGGECYLELRQR